MVLKDPMLEGYRPKIIPDVQSFLNFLALELEIFRLKLASFFEAWLLFHSRSMLENLDTSSHSRVRLPCSLLQLMRQCPESFEP